MIESVNGGKVWISCPEKGWISGEILNETSDSIIVKDENDKEITIKREDVKMQNPTIQEGIDDMTNLSYLHEPAVIHNLIRRYELNTIYTYTGTILIAINPYCKLSLYTKEMIDSFCDQPVAKLPPHVYAIAEASYREMLNHQKNQSILVSGESGAGKTESTKFLLQYFAAMGEKMGQSQQEAAENNNIEAQVIKSTPILEAFGNAKTLRNDNSSRFGKFIQIHFEKSRGTIIGANLETYLLEKSRIVKPPTNERSFHIFYQFLQGVSDETRTNLNISADPLDFNYLNQSGCHEIEEVDDKKVFEKTEKALRVVGFTDEDLLGVWKILAAILHCGNIEFREKDENSAEMVENSTLPSTNKEYSPLEKVCELLGCKADQLKNTLLQRNIKAGNESYTLPLTFQQANDARDSLAMYLYSRLFDWLVYRINLSIDKKKKDYLFIGILDIYGFESFEQNSFEQFTINYANEKLQNQFNHQIFKLEQQEYDKEKIDWSYIEFNDNQECIDLIEKKPLGILSILDEETQFPKATPATLSTKLYSNHTKSKHFEKPRFSNIHFTIDHYAGKVDYDTTLFLDKNKDFIIPEQVMALQGSSSDFFKKVIMITGNTSAASGDKKPAAASNAKTGSSLKFLSVTSQFKESLNHLMTTINTTNPHYIRCIKPNTLKKPNHFDNLMVLQQLRCGGVIEQLRISRSGFPGRLLYENFFKRYKLLAAQELRSGGGAVSSPSMMKDPKKGSEILIQKLKINSDKVQLGQTKIFFKSGIIANLEMIRGDLMKRSAIMIQKHCRGFIEKSRYRKMKQSALHLQTLMRTFVAKQMCYEMVELESATTLQTLIRSALAAREYQESVRAAVLLQTALRSVACGEQMRELKKEMAAVILQSYMRTFQQANYFKSLVSAVTKAQARWRGKSARRIYREMRIEARSLSNVVAEKNKLETKVEELQYRLKAELKIKEKEQDKLKDLQNQNQQLKQTIDDSNNKLIDQTKTIESLQSRVSELENQLQQNSTFVPTQQPVTIDGNDEQTQQLKQTIEEKNSKLNEYNKKVKQLSIRVKELEVELQQSNKSDGTSPQTERSARLAEEPRVEPPLIKRTEEDKLFVSPVVSEGAPTPNPTPTPSEVSEDVDAHLSSDGVDSYSDVDLSSKEEDDEEEQQPKIITMIDEKLQNEVLVLREKDQTNQLEITELNKQIAHLKGQLADQMQQHTNYSGRKSLASSTSNSPRYASGSPREVLRSISYTDFDQSTISEPTPRTERSSSVSTNGIPDLIAALEINNNQVGAGRYLIDSILKDNLGFVNGTIPEPCYIFSRCFLDEVLAKGSPVKLEMAYYFVDSVSLLTKESRDNDLLCYWLSNISLLFKVVDSYTPTSSNGNDLHSSNHGSSTPRPSMEVLQIKTLLQNLVIKIYKTLVRNILDIVQPICHKVLNDTADLEVMEPLTNFLTKIFNTLQVCHVFDPIRQLLMEQIFQYINSLMFNEIVLRRDLCCIRSSIHLKMNISELEYWAKNYGSKDLSNRSIAKLSLLKEAIYILMIDKSLLTNIDVRKEVCPSITAAQIKQLLTMYSPDLDSVEEPIPLEVLSAVMSSDDYNKSENILLDLSSIFTLPLNNLHCVTMNDLKKLNYTCDNLVSLLIKMNMSNYKK